MRETDVVRSAAFPARRDMQLTGRRRESTVGQKLLQCGLHYGCQRRRGILLVHPGIQLGCEFIADRDCGSSHLPSILTPTSPSGAITSALAGSLLPEVNQSSNGTPARSNPLPHRRGRTAPRRNSRRPLFVAVMIRSKVLTPSRESPLSTLRRPGMRSPL